MNESIFEVVTTSPSVFLELALQNKVTDVIFVSATNTFYINIRRDVGKFHADVINALYSSLTGQEVTGDHTEEFLKRGLGFFKSSASKVYFANREFMVLRRLREQTGNEVSRAWL